MIRLRPADNTDREYFLRLRREIDPTLTWIAHEAWWYGAQEHRFVAEHDGKPVGVIRIAPDGTLSLQVAEQERGKGIGTQMLVLIQEEARALGYVLLHANVDQDNRASRGAFLRARYAPVRFEVAL